MSTRLSWSSAVTLRSTNSPILPSISRVSLADLAAQIAVDLDDLQFGLRDLAGDLGGLRDQLRGFAFQPRRLALELGQLGERHELLLPQIVDAVLFALDQLGFLVLGDAAAP